jgi:phosphatidate cytidylyltransferase
VPALLTLRDPGYEHRQLLLIAFLVDRRAVARTCCNMCGASSAGRHKIAPRLSPSKTVEGFVGGVAVGHACSAPGCGGSRPSPAAGRGAGPALVVILMGFCGGLVMSAIKRDRGVKDWGHLIEGHGGMLDRLDSVCFAAPVFFHMTRYFLT